MRFIKFVLLFFVVFVVIASATIFGTYYSIPKLNSSTAILILGKGGVGHTAPDLTDTIMISSLNVESKKVSFISLPRDIWIPEMRAKLNTAYHYGGFKMAKDSVYSVTNIPISYTVVVDFTLFRDLIDGIGGINVDVENSFVDEKYPIEGLENDLCNGDKTYACRYEVLDIKSGKQTMNGELALKYVRSRNAKGDEGTDLAREKRQQKVIAAIKEKMLSTELLLNPKAILNLYSIVLSHVETDLDKNSLLSIGRFLFESRSSINFISIPENMIQVSQNDKKYDKQYVFIPKGGSWKDLQEWIKNSI